MFINSKSIGRYYLRLKPIHGFKLAGRVLLIKDITNENIVCNLAQGWEETNNNISVPVQYASDKGWHDITDIVLVSSEWIFPPFESYSFDDNANAYRNFIPNIEEFKLTEEQSIGKVVFRGKTNQYGNVELHNTAYFVTEYDQYGFAVARYGYCANGIDDIRIIRTRDTDYELYDANRVIGACNDMYLTDMDKAKTLIETSRDTMKPRDTTRISNNMIGKAETMNLF